MADLLTFPTVVISLGDVAFDVASAPLDSLRRSRSWRWAEQSPIGAAPSLSYMGPGESTLELHGIVYPGQLGDADLVDRLHALADAGEPHTLVDGAGFNYGTWVIESIDDDKAPLTAGGGALRIEYGVSLRRATEGASASALPGLP